MCLKSGVARNDKNRFRRFWVCKAIVLQGTLALIAIIACLSGVGKINARRQ